LDNVITYRLVAEENFLGFEASNLLISKQSMTRQDTGLRAPLATRREGHKKSQENTASRNVKEHVNQFMDLLTLVSEISQALHRS